MSSVKVRTKGQIVNTGGVRNLFNIQPGDMLLIKADINRSIALIRRDEYIDLLKSMMEAPSEVE